mmetsp:Transcript_98877/g.313882  ORF Transcript_98877/g.313882 Transcript_98877/m.313882 type:complete len:358 (+) Transcript_98877:72-1145(+)
MWRVLAAGFASSTVFSIVSELFTSSSPATQCLVSGGYFGCSGGAAGKHQDALANLQKLDIVERRLADDTFVAADSSLSPEDAMMQQIDAYVDQKCEEEDMSLQECEEFRQRVTNGFRSVKNFGPAIMLLVSLFLALMIASACAPCVAGCMYHPGVTVPKKPLFPMNPQEIPPPLSLAAPMGDFPQPLLSCTENMPVCCWSFCVPTVRQGDTLEVARVTGFWVPLLASMAVNIISAFVQDSARSIFGQASQVPAVIPLLASLLMAAIFGFWRGKLREQLGGPKMEYSQQFAVDTVTHCFCHPCAVAQEARQLDDVTGTQLECGCKFTYKGNPPNAGQPIVGMPVAVGGTPVQNNVLIR